MANSVSVYIHNAQTNDTLDGVRVEVWTAESAIIASNTRTFHLN